jgi:catechol 2,3-dioxygenase-like lactoylglutathione lyase family enzyme
MSDPFKTPGGRVPYGDHMPAFTAIGLVVSDMDRSLAFYRALGLDVPDGAADAPHVEIPLPGGLKLLLDTEDTILSFDSAWTAPTGSARAALAFECADAAEVDATYQQMVDAGFEGHLAPWDAFWGQHYAVLHDPDGNTVDLFSGVGA